MAADEGFGMCRDPDVILRQIQESERSEETGRGKLKIFFGYAAGVGKTYAMLEEAHAVAERGFDVAVGFVEPHTRVETMALLDGLEQIPCKEIIHRGITLCELDLDAALERHPQVLIVDELAHTNAPGSRHTKRFQDIEELLRAGISVFTTVNVQHLEGLNDKIAAITQVSVAERIPDRVFDRAASVELIDIDPDDLIERLKAGKIYVAERSVVALDNFFSKDNLGALREIALRRMADRMTRCAPPDAGVHAEAAEDVLVYITPDTASVKAIRAAANMAESYHGALTALVIESSESKKLDRPERAKLQGNIDLAEELGAHVVTLQGDDIAALIAQYSLTAGITQVVLAGSRKHAGIIRSRESLVNRLTRLTTGAVISVVPVSDLPTQLGRLRPATGFDFTSADVVKALVAIAVATVVGLAVFEMGAAVSVILMIYMLIALVFATRADGFFYAAIVALGSVVAYNFFFTIPRFTFNAYGLSTPFIFAFLMISTLVASSLTIRLKRQAFMMARRSYRTEVLLESSRKMQAATTMEECFKTAAEQVMKILDRPVVMYLLDREGGVLEPTVYDVPGSKGGDASEKELVAPGEVAVAAWVASNNERAGATTDTLRQARCLYLPVHVKDRVFGVAGLVLGEDSEDFGAFEKNLLLAIIDECGQSAEQLAFSQERYDMNIKVEKEAMRANLLRTISHDLRTPLTSISGDAEILLTGGERLTEEQKRRMYEDILDDSTWLIDLVENLLSVTRIDEGTVAVAKQPELVTDVVRTALSHTNRRSVDHGIVVELADELLVADMDPQLIMQVIVNLVNNAISHTPEGSRIVVSARAERTSAGDVVRIAVADDGPGIPVAEREHLFDLFYHGSSAGGIASSGDSRRGMGLGLALCRSIVRIHGGELVVGDASPHGSVFSFSLPLSRNDGGGL